MAIETVEKPIIQNRITELNQRRQEAIREYESTEAQIAALQKRRNELVIEVNSIKDTVQELEGLLAPAPPPGE